MTGAQLPMYDSNDDQAFQWDNCWGNYQWGDGDAADENLIPFTTKNYPLTSDAVDDFRLQEISIKGSIITVETDVYITLDKTKVVRVDGSGVSYWYYLANTEASGVAEGKFVRYVIDIGDRTIYSKPFCITLTQSPYRLHSDLFAPVFG